MKHIAHLEPDTLPVRLLCREYAAVFLQLLPSQKLGGRGSVPKAWVWALAAHASGQCELLGLWTVPLDAGAAWKCVEADLQCRGVEKVTYFVVPHGMEMMGTFPGATVLSSAAPLLHPRRSALAGAERARVSSSTPAGADDALRLQEVLAAQGEPAPRPCERASISLSPTLRHVVARAAEAARCIQARLLPGALQLRQGKRAEEWESLLAVRLARLSRPWIESPEVSAHPVGRSARGCSALRLGRGFSALA